ncbi:DUF5681 domain-containing protein [Roseibium aggregatum]|uniref:DUF5681 domain-containing protein n=1 Tax=Roseibium aggregatum TaxID=187304 RepID=UPI0006E14428
MTSWVAGQSGNPAGRPPGATNIFSSKARKIICKEAEPLAQKAVSLALEGNVDALRLCLECVEETAALKAFRAIMRSKPKGKPHE